MKSVLGVIIWEKESAQFRAREHNSCPIGTQLFVR